MKIDICKASEKEWNATFVQHCYSIRDLEIQSSPAEDAAYKWCEVFALQQVTMTLEGSLSYTTNDIDASDCNGDNM